MKSERALTTQTDRMIKLKPDYPITDKALKILANSIYQTLREEGCQNKDIIGVSSQLLGLVTSSFNADPSKD